MTDDAPPSAAQRWASNLVGAVLLLMLLALVLWDMELPSPEVTFRALMDGLGERQHLFYPLLIAIGGVGACACVLLVVDVSRLLLKGRVHQD